MIVKLLTEHYLEFLSLKGGCRGSSESTVMSKCHIVGNLMHWLLFNVCCCFIVCGSPVMGPCYVVWFLVSNYFDEEETAGCFTLIGMWPSVVMVRLVCSL